MIRYWCTCGAYVITDKANLAEQFKDLHTGSGHKPCNARVAARARRHEDAKAAQEDWQEKS